MNYSILGKLPDDFIEFFYTEILLRKNIDKGYQLIHFDKFLFDRFRQYFINELEIPWLPGSDTLPPRPIQKAFYSPVNSGWTIHKDGWDCKAALNIAIRSNSDDWVRWYDEKVVNDISSSSVKKFSSGLFSRETGIENYEDVPFIDELHVETGDVYVLDTDKFHSFKCLGPEPRLILQTKFAGNPNFETLLFSLQKSNFSNIII